MGISSLIRWLGASWQDTSPNALGGELTHADKDFTIFYDPMSGEARIAIHVLENIDPTVSFESDKRKISERYKHFSLKELKDMQKSKIGQPNRLTNEMRDRAINALREFGKNENLAVLHNDGTRTPVEGPQTPSK